VQLLFVLVQQYLAHDHSEHRLLTAKLAISSPS
jgi:hypothetical protein